MTEEPSVDLPVQPQQLIGGINGMILQLHKTNEKFEEAKLKLDEKNEKMQKMEERNQSLTIEVAELRKSKERLTEQCQFLQKSLEKRRVENNTLQERLKEVEIQLGESSSVLETVRNLETKNEEFNQKMTTIVVNAEEEMAKLLTERDQYKELLEHATKLNERNVAVFQSLERNEKSMKLDQEKVKVVIEKSEKVAKDLAKHIEETQQTKDRYSRLNEETEKGLEMCVRSNTQNLEEENQDLKNKLKELEAKYTALGRNVKEIRKTNDNLKEQLIKQSENHLKEGNALKQKLNDASARSLLENSEKQHLNKQFDSIDNRMKEMVELCGNNAKQLRNIQSSVEENRDYLKANIDGVLSHKNEVSEKGDCEKDGKCCSGFSQEYYEVVVQIEEIFKHLQIRDEELASLERIAGLPEQRENDYITTAGESDYTCIASSIRGIVALKDNQIDALVKERNDIAQEMNSLRKTEYKQCYILEEVRKEKEELATKLKSLQEKYHNVKEEKEEIRKELLVRDATDKMTETLVKNLKVENEQYKTTYTKQQEILKQKYNALKYEQDKTLESKEAIICDIGQKLTLCEQQRDRFKQELERLYKKDSEMKEQIISIFSK